MDMVIERRSVEGLCMCVCIVRFICGLQQGEDCGEEAVLKPADFSVKALVAPSGDEELKEFVCWMRGVSNYAVFNDVDISSWHVLSC